jgi:3-oxoacyl-[acyl-carrier protein] reductase
MAIDISERKEVERMVADVHKRLGPVGILVNNAGIQGPIGPVADNDSDEWLRTIEVNLIGTFHSIKSVLPGMIARRRGKIINLSGGGATSPRPNFSAYAVSKTAVVRLTETLAEEVKPFNIQVNAIAPGAINTRMLDRVLAAGAAAGDELAFAQRCKREGGTPVELAAALVVFLASSASDGLTGKLISAPHDDWQTWDVERIRELSNSAWYTLRRIDTHTLHPLLKKIQ